MDKKELKRLYGKTLKSDPQKNKPREFLEVLCLILFGILGFIIALPVSVVLKEQKSPKAKILMIASVIGAILYIVGIFIGWQMLREDAWRMYRILD